MNKWFKLAVWTLFGRPYKILPPQPEEEKRPIQFCFGYWITRKDGSLITGNLDTEQAAHDWALENLNLWGKLYENN